jgi:hypothetical protein
MLSDTKNLYAVAEARANTTINQQDDNNSHKIATA